jgi:hypothetical protein
MKLSERQIDVLRALAQGHIVEYVHGINTEGWYWIRDKNSSSSVRKIDGGTVESLDRRKFIQRKPYKNASFATQFELTESGLKELLKTAIVLDF